MVKKRKAYKYYHHSWKRNEKCLLWSDFMFLERDIRSSKEKEREKERL